MEKKVYIGMVIVIIIMAIILGVKIFHKKENGNPIQVNESEQEIAKEEETPPVEEKQEKKEEIKIFHRE